MLGELTTLEIRILASLTEPQTSKELFENLDLGYPYGIKVLKRLKTKKYVDHQQRGNYTYYFTIRSEDTEDLYAVRAQTTGKSEYLFPFKGNWMSFADCARSLQKGNRDIALFELCKKILYNIQYNSHRKENQLPLQRPYAEDMRRKLEGKLAQARSDILFAEEILKAPIWGDSANDWKTVSSLVPDMEKGKKNSDELEKLIYKQAQ